MEISQTGGGPGGPKVRVGAYNIFYLAQKAKWMLGFRRSLTGPDRVLFRVGEGSYEMLSGNEKITLFLGNYGSGKTEVAVNFALHLAQAPPPLQVTLVDLDLVNPYFRSREAREVLERHGLSLVTPNPRYQNADLPILVPEVRAALRASTSHTILDVGGDNVGARVLGSLHDSLPLGSYRAIMVLNGLRPFTADVDGIEQLRGEIESAGRIAVSGFVSNTHLMDETTLETVIAGWHLASEVAARTGLPLEFVCAPPELIDAVEKEVDVPVLPVRRYLAPSWKDPAAGRENQGKELFRLQG